MNKELVEIYVEKEVFYVTMHQKVYEKLGLMQHLQNK